MAPPPDSLTFVQRLIGPNPLLGRLGWRVCIPGGRGRQAGTEEVASSNEGTGACGSPGEEKSKYLRCSWMRLTGGQGGGGASALPAFARRSALSTVTTLDGTSCHSGREQSQDTLACHSLFCTRAEGGSPKTGHPDRGKLTLSDAYTYILY